MDIHNLSADPAAFLLHTDTLVGLVDTSGLADTAGVASAQDTAAHTPVVVTGAEDIVQIEVVLPLPDTVIEAEVEVATDQIDFDIDYLPQVVIATVVVKV